MCDYSLHNNPTRLAQEGEPLVAYRFRSGSIGLASPSEINNIEVAAHEYQRTGWWQQVRSWFLAPPERHSPVCAVCVPPGSELYVHDFPVALQQELGIGDSERVVFTQVSAEEYVHRDAIRFQNGKQLLLQRLREGQEVVVLALTEEPVGHAERHAVHI